MNTLQVLKDARPALLLAEVGALLHNIGKLSPHFIDVMDEKADIRRPDYDYQMIVGIIGDYLTTAQSRGKPFEEKYRRATDTTYHPKTTGLLDADTKSWLTTTRPTLPPPLSDRSYALADFIEFQDKAWFWDKKGKPRAKDIFPNGLRAVALLERSHDAASGGEKEAGELVEEEVEQVRQSKDSPCRASVFGIESPVSKTELDSLRTDVLDVAQTYVKTLNFPQTIFSERDRLFKAMRDTLVLGLGDTQRPINDVTVWDLGASVAALYKAAVAKALLQEEWRQVWTNSLFDGEWHYDEGLSQASWRLLSIRLNGLDFLSNAHGLPDLIGRREAVQAGLDAVRELLEVTYPLGNEIYRDEHGSIFVVPDLIGDDSTGDKLLGLSVSETDKRTLRQLIESAFRSEEWLDGELEITPQVTPRYPGKQLQIGTILRNEPPAPQAVPDKLAEWWEPKGKHQWHRSRIQDVCTVCGVRPQGFVPYGVGVPIFANDPEKGYARNVCGVCLARRGRRAEQWATKELHTTIWTDEVADEHRRLALVVGRFDPDGWLSVETKDATGQELPIGSLVQTMAVGFKKDGRPVPKNPSFARLRRVWETTQEFWEKVRDTDIPEVVSERPGRWRIIPDDQENIWRKSHLDLGSYHSYELVTKHGRLSVVWHYDGKYFLSAEDVSRFEKPAIGETCALYEPTGYGSPVKAKGSIVVLWVQDESTSYIPSIPILAYPATFMQLVPADKALDVAARIKARYAQEMGKVRNRLPMALGLVFFDVKTPLRAVLDAGRRMLQMPLAEEFWVVNQVTVETDAKEHCWAVVRFKKDDKPLWRVPVSMGDKSEDKWYPYYFLESKLDPSKHIRTFQYTYLDGKETKTRNLVHVADLQPNDKVAVTPALLDFVYLDVTGRRFEVAYQRTNDEGKPERLDKHQQRKPYYLEQLDDLTDLWELLRKKLTTKQINDMLGLIETKRREWQENSVEFKTFVENTLKNADWRGGWDEIEDKKLLIQAAQSGMLNDVRELYMVVMKQKTETDQPTSATT